MKLFLIYLIKPNVSIIVSFRHVINLKIISYATIFLVLSPLNLMAILLQHISVCISHSSRAQEPRIPSGGLISAGVAASCTFIHFMIVNIV